MGKNILLLVIVLLLGGLTYVGINKSKEKKDYAELMADRDFNVENLDDIHQIKISPRARLPILLEKKGDKWFVGDRRANMNMVTNMLQALKNVKVKYIPSKNATKNVINEINQVGIQIDLYDKDDENFKSFFIGGNTHDERGTYFIMQGETQPYVMTMPYVVGGLRDIFLHQDFEYWDHTYVLLDPEKIVSITADFPKDKPNSFVIKKTDGDFMVNPLYPTTTVINRKVNQNTVKAYLTEYKSLASEAFENDNPNKEKIRSRIPFATFTIETEDGETTEIKYHPVLDFLEKDMELNDLEIKNLKMVERFFVDTNWGDLYVAQKRLCVELFRGYPHFFR